MRPYTLWCFMACALIGVILFSTSAVDAANGYEPFRYALVSYPANWIFDDLYDKLLGSNSLITNDAALTDAILWLMLIVSALIGVTIILRKPLSK